MIASVRAKNLFSFKELEVPFEPGITMYEGFNHDDGTEEAVGKSSILNIVSWVLYGEIPKDVKIDDVVRIGEKSGSGMVDLKNGFSVFRSRRPNDLYLFDSATQEKIKGKDAKETQEMIIQKVGMSFKTFCQAVYFAQNYPNKFITATEEDKAKILAEIDDLSQFDRARKEATQKVKTLEAELSTTALKLSHAIQSRDTAQQQVTSLRKLISVQAQEREQKLAKLTEDLKSAESLVEARENSLKSMEESLTDLQAEKDHINSATPVITSKKYEIERSLKEVDALKIKVMRAKEKEKAAARAAELLNSKIMKLQTPVKGQSCPTCGTDLSKADEATLNKHIEELKLAFQEKDKETLAASQEAYELEASIPDTEESKGLIEQLNSDFKLLMDRGREIDKALMDVQKAAYELEMLRKSVSNISNDLQKSETSIQSEETQKLLSEAEYQQSKFILDAERLEDEKSKVSSDLAKYSALKDAFKEVKSFAFRNTLAELTHKSNFYMSQLFNQEVRIEFSNEGDAGELSKILCKVSIDGDERPLGLYSGGQFRRIQLSVDLALSDLISSRNQGNLGIRFFDEYFKDLSETSMENCLRLFQTLKGTTILIEHNSLFKSIVNQTVHIELTDGVSRIVESEYGSKILEM
jgi:DNA repair exonuclease SbcCD ATPase subunit